MTAPNYQNLLQNQCSKFYRQAAKTKTEESTARQPSAGSLIRKIKESVRRTQPTELLSSPKRVVDQSDAHFDYREVAEQMTLMQQRKSEKTFMRLTRFSRLPKRLYPIQPFTRRIHI